MRDRKRHLPGSPWLLLLGLLFAGGLLTSCTGGGDGDADGGDFDVEAARTEVELAREEAEAAQAAKYAPDTWEKALSRLEKAEEAAGNPERQTRAKGYFDMAQRGFVKAAREAEKNEKQVGQVESVQKEFDTLLAKALEGEEGAKLPLEELDPQGLAEARAKYDEARAYLEEQKLDAAKRRFGAALSTLKNTISGVERKIAQRKSAADARDRMQAAKERALEAEAATKAAGDLGYADSQALLGQQAFEGSQFEMAVNYFNAAESYYNTAFTTANAAANRELASGEGRETPDGNPRESYRPAPEIERIEPPEDGGEMGGFVDGMDWLFGRLHVAPENHEGLKFGVRYGIGQGPDLKQDLQLKLGASTTHFEGAEGVGVTSYLMGGNTLGYALFEPVFRDWARVEVEFQFQLVAGADSTFQIVLMSGGGEDFYGSHFGTNVVISSSTGRGKIVPSAKSEYNQHVSKWLQRREPVRLVFEYKKVSEDEEGVLEVHHDGELVCKFKSDRYRSGRVGFYWKNAKWFINELIIQGQVDEQWLVEAAREAGASQGEDESQDDEDDGGFGF